MVFDLKPEEDVYWCSADVGWITGHSYIVYGPLANGCTSVMFEGAPDYPDKDVWWSIVERYGVSLFYTAPTAIRACMKWGEEFPARHDRPRCGCSGRSASRSTRRRGCGTSKVSGRALPIVDTWWQTETGAIMITPLPGITATKPGSADDAAAGRRGRVVDEDGDEVGPTQGCSSDAAWPGMLRTLYEDDDRSSRRTSRVRARLPVGDAARATSDGYGSSGASTTSSTSPGTAVDRRVGVGDRLAPRWPRPPSSASSTRTPARRSSRS
jgi:acetyl-CoA synthetase